MSWGREKSINESIDQVLQNEKRKELAIYVSPAHRKRCGKENNFLLTEGWGGSGGSHY